MIPGPHAPCEVISSLVFLQVCEEPETSPGSPLMGEPVKEEEEEDWNGKLNDQICKSVPINLVKLFL